MFEALNKCLDRLESVAMVVFMSIATVLTTIQVVYRYGLAVRYFGLKKSLSIPLFV